MGRIKSTLVKRTARNMLKEQNNFSESFETDKKLLVGTMPSKRIRNKIAGYVARLKKREMQEKK
jgi:ribosomal protein S17E